MVAASLQETALYEPVKRFLEARGFEAKGEVCGCDIVAVRPGEPPLMIIAELKLSFTLELALQAVDRLRSADEVYLATVTGGGEIRTSGSIGCAAYSALA